MVICNGCGGVLGRVCGNEQDCVQISRHCQGCGKVLGQGCYADDGGQECSEHKQDQDYEEQQRQKQESLEQRGAYNMFFPLDLKGLDI